MAAGAGKVALSSTTTRRSAELVQLALLTSWVMAQRTASKAPARQPRRPTQRQPCASVEAVSTRTITTLISPSALPTRATPLRRLRTCDFTPAAIHDIQGPGLVTPFLGQDVSTTGIVTGLRRRTASSSRQPDASIDANPSTSEAIFVFTSARAAGRRRRRGDGEWARRPSSSN